MFCYIATSSHFHEIWNIHKIHLGTNQMWTKLWGPIKCGQALKAAVQYYRTPILLLNYTNFWLQWRKPKLFCIHPRQPNLFWISEGSQNDWVLISMLTSGSCNWGFPQTEPCVHLFRFYKSWSKCDIWTPTPQPRTLLKIIILWL